MGPTIWLLKDIILIRNFSSRVETIFHSFALFQHWKRHSIPQCGHVISFTFFSEGNFFPGISLQEFYFLGINFFINYYPPPSLKTSHGQLLNNDRPGVRFINTWDLQLLFHSYGFRGSFQLDSYFYVLPLFQKYIFRTLQVQVCLGFLVTWFHEKAVKTKDNNLVNWQSINSSNNLQYFESGTPSKGGKIFREVDNGIVNYLWKQSFLGKGGKEKVARWRRIHLGKKNKLSFLVIVHDTICDTLSFSCLPYYIWRHNTEFA